MASQADRNNRSRVTNGALFVDRSIHPQRGWARRFADIIMLHTSDLGGADYVSAAEASIIRRASAETVELELLEEKFAKNGKGAKAEDLDLYARISNSLGRHLDRIGLKRVAKDVTPTLEDIAEEIETERRANIGRSDATDAADAEQDDAG
jgi:hypothetical protein